MGTFKVILTIGLVILSRLDTTFLFSNSLINLNIITENIPLGKLGYAVIRKHTCLKLLYRAEVILCYGF